MEHDSDRLYWTIGVILIGAALVAIAMKFFPGLMDKIKVKLEKMIGNISADPTPIEGQAVSAVALLAASPLALRARKMLNK